MQYLEVLQARLIQLVTPTGRRRAEEQNELMKRTKAWDMREGASAAPYLAQRGFVGGLKRLGGSYVGLPTIGLSQTNDSMIFLD